jgi:hypothetical protein
MAQQSQLTLGPLPVENTSRGGEISRPSEGDNVSLTRLLADACNDVGLLEKEAALAQGYDPKYWPRCKSGEKNAYLDRVQQLPLHAQREFVRRYARQLKMHVSDEDARRRALADLACAVTNALREIG